VSKELERRGRRYEHVGLIVWSVAKVNSRKPAALAHLKAGGPNCLRPEGPPLSAAQHQHWLGPNVGDVGFEGGHGLQVAPATGFVPKFSGQRGQFKMIPPRVPLGAWRSCRGGVLFQSRTRTVSGLPPSWRASCPIGRVGLSSFRRPLRGGRKLLEAR
jgi:hypothetical protein